jgi:uncharacterized repeat protein (TIGR01451 family)
MTNHNPNITSSNATGSFSEDANTTGSTVDHVLNGTMNFTDSDHSDTHTTTTALKTAVWSGGSTLPSGALAKFQTGMTSSILTDNNGSGKLKWTFSEDDDDFDFLAKNETIVLTYEITLKDNHGGSTKKTVKITVTGTDDKPVFATAAGATLTEQANKTLSLSHDTAHIALQFTDVDLNNTGHTASVLSVSAAGNTSGILPGAWGTAELMSFFDIQNVVKTAGSSNGVVNTKFSAPDLAFDYLADGEQIVITYVVQVDDKKGGLSTQNVVVTVNGTNDKPVVIGFPECENLTEGQDLSGGNLTADGEFHFSDIDLSDTHEVSTTVTATLSGGGTVPISEADLIDAMGAALDNDSTSDLFGKVVWSFALPDSAVNFLAEGETLTLTYHIIVTDPSGASDSEEVTIKVHGADDPVIVTKTADVTSVDAAGDVINYTITFENGGSQALTGVTVSDPLVADLTYSSGDADSDGVLDGGEIWHYTASYTVTQFDIDNFGMSGEGAIENTVTVDTDQTSPISATATVAVEQDVSLEVTKTADVTSVNSAGDVINYTVNVTNTGNTTLFSLVVTDPQLTVVTPILGDPVLSPDPLQAPVLVGDYNAGDENENGIEDEGETFQYVASGDENQNGIQDNGETWQFANIGDANQNGNQDPGETFEFYNAGDTNHDGEENGGETFQFNVNDQMVGVDTNNDAYNDGDDNNNDRLDAGETWQFTGSYTVTQDDIDNGGVVNTATATTDKVTESASTSVDAEQNPSVTLAKDATVSGGTATAGEVISYTIAVSNNGNVTLTNPVVSDPSVSEVAAVMSGSFNAGDANTDGKLSVGETWQYTASYTVTQADIDNDGGGDGTIDNTASVDTDQGATASDGASVDVVGTLVLTKTSSLLIDGDESGGPSVEDPIQYFFSVVNNGTEALHGTMLDDSLFGMIAFTPDTPDGNGLLDPGETWLMSETYVTTQDDIDDGIVVNEATLTGLTPTNVLVTSNTAHWELDF